jgi:hypothetical protein
MVKHLLKYYTTDGRMSFRPVLGLMWNDDGNEETDTDE